MAESQNKYQGFLDALNQLSQDQTFYESDLLNSDELRGVRHEELIKLGGIMCKRLKKFAEKGEIFADELPPDILPKFIDSITSYQTLIIPPKVFGGFCPCLKPARNGPEYDRKFFITKAKMVSSIFVSYALLINKKADDIVSRSSHFDVYVDDMNRVFVGLQEIKCSNSEPKHLEAVRRKLNVSLEGVDKFIQLHGERTGKPEFRTEAIRSLKKVQDLLTVKPPTPTTGIDGPGGASAATSGSVPIGRRILIKAQSTLQEIMNSAAAISATEAKQQIEQLESLNKTLKKSRESEVAQFNSMEEQMTELNVTDVLNRLREDSEIIHSDASSKVRDSIKRWTNIKNKSAQRKVAEYTEEGVSSFNPIVNIGHNPHNFPTVKPINDAKKLARSTTEKFNELGKKTKDVFDTAGNEMLTGLTNVTKSGTDVMKKVGHVFTGESGSDAGSSGHGVGTSKDGGDKGGFSISNPFDKITSSLSPPSDSRGGGAGGPKKPKKPNGAGGGGGSGKKGNANGGMKFNPLDFS
jgi:vacuolar-type H+-ATPase subunit E/Vma4